MEPGPKTCKSCDQCRRSKIRCTIVRGDTGLRCTNCIKRGELCRFKEIKRKLRRPLQVPQGSSNGAGGAVHEPQAAHEAPPSIVSIGTQSVTTPLPKTPQPDKCVAQTNYLHAPGRLLIDEIIEMHQENDILTDGPYMLKHSPQVVVASSCIAFWSERKIATISERIGSPKLRDLVDQIEGVLRARSFQSTEINFQEPNDATVSEPKAQEYIQAYFDHVHPMYPFLDRSDFEQAAFRSTGIHSTNPRFSALYNAVLALGCQYCVGGSFDPGKGSSWNFFQKALSLIPTILVPRECLLTLQALIAMSIFALNTCCLQIEDLLTMEAARVATTLWYHKSRRSGLGLRQQETCFRSFWVLYTMEKQQCLDSQRHSLFSDDDICSPIPWTPESVFSGYNSFHSSIRFARISSILYTSLFTVSASSSSVPQYQAKLDHVQGLLHQWLMSVPENFRPGKLRASYNFSSPVARMVFLQTSYRYYNVVIILARLRLHLDEHDPAQENRRNECKMALMSAARAVIELTRYIDIDAHTQAFVIGCMPMASLFILFDFVIRNPTNPETKQNLLLLDVAAGHFSRLEYASGGSWPASLLAEFSHIAKQYVKSYEKATPPAVDSNSEQGDGSTTLAGRDEGPTSESVGSETLTHPLLSVGSDLSWGLPHHTVTAAPFSDIESLSVAVEDTEMDGFISGFDFRSLFGHTFSNAASLLQSGHMEDVGGGSGADPGLE